MNAKTAFHITKLFLLISILLSISVNAENTWNLIKDSDGIQVFNKDIDGSEIKEFKGTAIIDAPIEVIFSVMIDVQAGPLWMNRCIESKLLKRIDEFAVTKNGFHSRSLVYNAIGAPFPVSNRDFIVETEMNGDSKTKSITINIHSVIDSGVPVRNGYVRMTELKASWIFQYIDQNHTRAIYQAKQNPGGFLNEAIVNYINRNIPFQTISGLRKITKNEKYIEAGKKIIEKRLWNRER